MTGLQRFDLPLSSMANGHELSLPIFSYTGSDPSAPKTYIQANIHGAEIQGSAVIYRLMQLFEQHPPRGSLTIVPQCNPYGMNLKFGEYTYGRFHPGTGENWNRGYVDITCSATAPRQGTYQVDVEDFVQRHRELGWEELKGQFKAELQKAYARCRQERGRPVMSMVAHLNLTLQAMTWDADIVLDLHTGPLATRYLYAPEYARSSAQHFGIPHVLLIPHQFGGALDEATFTPWCRLHQALEDCGVEGASRDFEAFTVELESEESFDLKRAQREALQIFRYLQHRGVVFAPTPQGPPQDEIHACFLRDYISLYAPQGGFYHFHVAPGEAVAEGGLICEILNFQAIHGPQDLQAPLAQLRAPRAGRMILRSPTCTLHQGSRVCDLMTKTFPLVEHP